jgi:hypothetical protein
MRLVAMDVLIFLATTCLLVAERGNFRISRHEMVVGALSDLAREAGFGIRINPSGSLPWSHISTHADSSHRGQISLNRSEKKNSKVRKSFHKLKPVDLMITDSRQTVIDVTIKLLSRHFASRTCQKRMSDFELLTTQHI